MSCLGLRLNRYLQATCMGDVRPEEGECSITAHASDAISFDATRHLSELPAAGYRPGDPALLHAVPRFDLVVFTASNRDASSNCSRSCRAAG